MIIVIAAIAIPVVFWWILRPTDKPTEINFPVDHRDHIETRF